MFDNVELPEEIQYGSAFGAGTNTKIQEAPSGHEIRFQMAAQARHRFSLIKQLQSSDEASVLKAFMLGRRGSFAAFLIKDWLDYNTSPNGQGAISSIDELIGTGNGTKKVYGLSKTYEKLGPRPYVRRLKNVVESSVVVAIDGNDLAVGSDYNLTSMGEIVLASNLAMGEQLTAGCEFRVPVRAGKSLDDWAKLDISSFDNWNMAALELIEVLDEEEWPDRRDPGGGRDWGSNALDVYLNFRDGCLQRIVPTANINVYLPVPYKAPQGWMHFVVFNDAPATYTLQVKDDAGNNVGSTIAPGALKVFGFFRGTSTTRWIQT